MNIYYANQKLCTYYTYIALFGHNSMRLRKQELETNSDMCVTRRTLLRKLSEIMGGAQELTLVRR
jgi:hypothetical protein